MTARSAPVGLGLVKGLGVTLKHMLKPATTQQYPHVRPELPPRTRGVIGLMDENCTVCMLCARECPDWCIYIESHKETVPPAKEGGRARTRNVLDRFAIDFALCMYCGICIEVCPFDALFWSPEFEYSTYAIGEMTHEMERLRAWMDTVPPPPALDDGAEPAGEVTTAIEKKNKPAPAKTSAATRAPSKPAAKKTAARAARPAAAEVEVEAGAIDQETYDRLIAEGKSERIARSKAKAAYVKKAKARAAEQAPAPVAAAEVEVEAGTIDQETYDRLIAEGKSERIARAKAKAAYVKKAKAAARAAADPAPPAEASETAARPGAASRKLADVHVEGAGEIDQETYDRLVAEGKSERIARAKAKAAWVKKQKAAQLDEGDDQ